MPGEKRVPLRRLLRWIFMSQFDQRGLAREIRELDRLADKLGRREEAAATKARGGGPYRGDTRAWFER